ncbi:MAG: hypothetical protein PHW40_04105 [Candidatus Izemoplasmatales bacterium]|nr:hypothetical protein [Candidatus Izemoplasmatales bacterium]
MRPRIFRLCVLLCLSVVVMGCRINRVWVYEDLDSIAREQFYLSETYFFKSVDSDTARAITGSLYRNAGIMVGKRGEADVIVFFPRQLKDEPFLVDFFFPFSISEMLDTLDRLENESGQPLMSELDHDFGGMGVSVAGMIEIRNHFPSLDFDSDIVFTFTSISHEFYVVSVQGRCVVISDQFTLLN